MNSSCRNFSCLLVRRIVLASTSLRALLCFRSCLCDGPLSPVMPCGFYNGLILCGFVLSIFIGEQFSTSRTGIIFRVAVCSACCGLRCSLSKIVAKRCYFLGSLISFLPSESLNSLPQSEHFQYSLYPVSVHVAAFAATLLKVCFSTGAVISTFTDPASSLL